MEYASLLFLFHRFFNSDGKSEKVGKIPELPSGTLPTHIAAGCKIYVAAAGLLTYPALRAFPSCRCDRIVACAESTGPCGRDLQQRELLPIRTAFPFNSLVAVESAMRKPLHGKDSFFSGRCCRIVKKSASGRSDGVPSECFSKKYVRDGKYIPESIILWTRPAKRRVTGFETWCTDFLQYNLCKICLVSI